MLVHSPAVFPQPLRERVEDGEAEETGPGVIKGEIMQHTVTVIIRVAACVCAKTPFSLACFSPTSSQEIQTLKILLSFDEVMKKVNVINVILQKTK